MKEESKHLIEYSILVMGVVLFLSLFYYFRFDKNILVWISAGGSFFYAIWGIIHHRLEDRLTKLIIIEYVLFSILVFLLLLSVLSF